MYDIIEQAYEEDKAFYDIVKCVTDVDEAIDELFMDLVEPSNEARALRTLFNGVKILTGFKQYTKLSDFVVAPDPVIVKPVSDKGRALAKKSDPAKTDTTKKTEHTKHTLNPAKAMKLNKFSEDRIKKLQFAFDRMDRQFKSRWVTRLNGVLNNNAILKLNKAASEVSSSTTIKISSEFVASLGLKRMFRPLRTFATPSIIQKESYLNPTLINTRDVLMDYDFPNQDIALLKAAYKSRLYKLDVVFQADGEVEILVAQPFKNDNTLRLLNAQLFRGTIKREPEKVTAGDDTLSSAGVSHLTLGNLMSITVEEYRQRYDDIVKERELLNSLLVSEFARLEAQYVGTYFWYINAAYKHNTAKLRSLVNIIRDLKNLNSKLIL